MAEDAAAFVNQQISAVNSHMRMLSSAEEDLTKGQRLTDAEAQCLMQLTGEQALAALQKQVAAWQAFLAGDKPESTATGSAASMPSLSDESRRTKARSKLAQMGGQPVLGGMLNMSEADLLSHRAALKASSSRAAQEMAQLRDASAGEGSSLAGATTPSPPPACLEAARNNAQTPAMHTATET